MCGGQLPQSSPSSAVMSRFLGKGPSPIPRTVRSSPCSGVQRGRGAAGEWPFRVVVTAITSGVLTLLHGLQPPHGVAASSLILQIRERDRIFPQLSGWSAGGKQPREASGHLSLVPPVSPISPTVSGSDLRFAECGNALRCPHPRVASRALD